MGVKRWWVALLILAAACTYSSTGPDGDTPSGTWRWLESTGGIAGVRYTPSSEGYNVRYVFSGNQVSAFRNDSLKATSLITVRDDEITYQPSISVFVFGGGIDVQTLQVISADTIMLHDPCCDRFSHRFVRAD